MILPPETIPNIIFSPTIYVHHVSDHYERKLELQRRENESYIHEANPSFTGQHMDEDEAYTATKFYTPTALNMPDMLTPKQQTCKTRLRSPHVTFEPYASPRFNESKQYSHFQYGMGNHVFDEPKLDVSSNNWSSEEHRDSKDSWEREEHFERKDNVLSSQGKLYDMPLIKATQCEPRTTEDIPISNHKDFGQNSELMVRNLEQVPNLNSYVSKIKLERDNENGSDLSIYTDGKKQLTSTPCVNSKKAAINDINDGLSPTFLKKSWRTEKRDENEHFQLQDSGESLMNKSNGEGNENDCPSKSKNYQVTAVPEKELGSSKTSESVIATDEQNANILSKRTNVSKLRCSKSLLRKYEVNNALKQAKARRVKLNCGNNIPISSGKSSIESIDSEQNAVELQRRGTKSEHTEEQCFADGREQGLKCRGNGRQSPLGSIKPDSESELEIVAIEPGSVFVFKDSFNKVKELEDMVPSKQKEVMKHIRSKK